MTVPSESPGAAGPPKVPPTADDIDRQWRCWGVTEVMIRNSAVDDFVREKEAEIDRLTAEVARLREALEDATAHLVGAASAYRKHASRHQSKGRAVPDALFSTRANDFDKAAERARAALKEPT